MQTTTRENLKIYLQESGIPAHMWAGIEGYVFDRTAPGHFLTAILSNDLKGAVAHADLSTQALIPAYVRCFKRHLPEECWGSPQKFAGWLRGVSS